MELDELELETDVFFFISYRSTKSEQVPEVQSRC